MRFIIRELPYEKPLAAGQLRYELNGRPTGTLEKWRLTSAVSGYRFLRVDLDGRDGSSGNSYLYHLVLNEHGHPERLSYRFWGSNLEIVGNVLLEEEFLTNSREINNVHYEDTASLTQGCTLWFPSSIGLGLLANCTWDSHPPGDGYVSTVTLNVSDGDSWQNHEEAFALQQTEVQLALGAEDTIEMMGQEIVTRSFNIRWGNTHERVIWLDEHNWPVKMRREDGLTAIERRYVRYG